MDVIGAGVGRTGTLSLKAALERLLGGRCYHLIELLRHPKHVDLWDRAIDGHPPKWNAIFGDYQATMDWWGALFFRELTDAYPDSLVVLSVRDPDQWWRSVRATMVEELQSEVDLSDPIARALAPARPLALKLLRRRFTPRWPDEAAVKAAFERHNAAVRASVPAHRLIEWQPGDGWEPICAALGVPVPPEPFPHLNTTADFLATRF